jgi:hypothetical protein
MASPSNAVAPVVAGTELGAPAAATDLLLPMPADVEAAGLIAASQNIVAETRRRTLERELRRRMFPNKRGNLSRDEQRAVRQRVEAAMTTHGGVSGTVPLSTMQSSFSQAEENIDVLLETFYECHDAFDRVVVLRQQAQEESENLRSQVHELQIELTTKNAALVGKNSQLLTLGNQMRLMETKLNMLQGEEPTLESLENDELIDLLGTLTSTMSKVQALQRRRQDSGITKCYVCHLAMPNRCLPCGHMYCATCVAMLGGRCGMCRQFFDDESIIKVFNMSTDA